MADIQRPFAQRGGSDTADGNQPARPDDVDQTLAQREARRDFCSNRPPIRQWLSGQMRVSRNGVPEDDASLATELIERRMEMMTSVFRKASLNE